MKEQIAHSKARCLIRQVAKSAIERIGDPCCDVQSIARQIVDTARMILECEIVADERKAMVVK